MKQILYILLLLSFFLPTIGNSQTFVPRTNGTYTPTDKYLGIPGALYIPKVCDTLINPLHGGKDSLGAMIIDTCNHKVWIRDFANGSKYWMIVSDIQLDSNSYILNQNTYGQNANFWVKGKGIVGSFNTYRSALVNGFPAQFYVTHSGGNFGLCIQRATSGISGANLAFYHTQSTDPDVPSASILGDHIGVITWMGVSTDGTIVQSAQEDALVEKISTSYVSAGRGWYTTDTNGVITDRMHLTAMGDFRLGGNATTLYRLHIQSGDAYFAANTYHIGFIGHNTTSPTSGVDINAALGYNQLRLRTTYTPTSTADTNGNTGDVSWDDNFFYIKTSGGWKRSALSTF